MGPIIGIRELLSMIVRRGPLIAILLMAGLVATISHVTGMGRSYQATTVIQLEPSVLQASSAEGGPDTAARLRLLEQRIMVRENIVDMIERYDFFEGAEAMTELQQVALFRQLVRIEIIPSASGGGAETGVSALLVIVDAGNPLTAAELANDIANQIVSGTRAVTERRLAELVAALQEENARLSKLVDNVQARAETVRREERDALPDNLETLQARITALDGQKVDLARGIQALERERLALEVSGTPGDETGGAASLVEQIGALQVQLAQASRRLGANHPEVLRLQDMIAELRGGGVTGLPAGVQRQIALIDEQLAAMAQEQADVDRSISQANAAIARMPQVAEQLDQLERQRRALEIQREATEARLASARLDTALISDEHGERMVVLERATPPEYPQSSSRRRIAVLGLAGSLAVAFLAAFAMELTQPVLRTSRQLQHALGVAPIASARRRLSPWEWVGARLRVIGTLAILGFGGFLCWQMAFPPEDDTTTQS